VRGSVSVELLIILLVAVYLILGVARGFLDKGVYYASDVDRIAALRASAQKLAYAAETAGYGSIGTRIHVYIIVPQGGSISWSGRTITGTLQTLSDYNACPNKVCTYELNIPFTFNAPGSIGAPTSVVVEKNGPGIVRVIT